MTAQEFPAKDEKFPSYDESKTEFWFDYLADAGDGTKAMYSIAYLALSSLWTKLDANATLLPAAESERKVSTINDGQEPFSFLLPRGEFLFVGGDTSYHAADYMTLFNRIQHPFNYAYEDLRARNLISEERRPIFGIPGNHDYYDQIDGFRRQFRKPIRKEGPFPPNKSGGAFAQLTIAGFKRVQEASYVAIRLPFGWRLWGLDTESPSNRSEQNLDLRQQEFFRNLAKGPDGKFREPEKLILATSAPSTYFGRLAEKKDRKVARPMEALHISRPFLPDSPVGQTDLTETGDMKLKTGQCRLDLSGDVHHYARYWGPESPLPTPRKENTAPQPAAQSYASIVSGLGGAFHHDSTTYDNQICEQVLYPSEETSREAFANRLFKFWHVFTGGRVWAFGLVIAFAIYFGASVAQSGRQFLGSIGFLNTLHLSSYEPIKPTVVRPTDSQTCAPVKPFGLWTPLVNQEWRPPAGCTAENPTYIFAQPSGWPLDLVLGQVSIFVALILIVVTLVLSIFTKKIFDDENPFKNVVDPAKKLWPIIGGVMLLMIVGFFSITPYREHIAPFGISILVLFSMIAAIAIIGLSLRYGDYRFKKSFVPDGGGDTRLEVIFWIFAVIIFGSGLWFFGKYTSPALLVSDILFMVVVIAGVAGIAWALPFEVAGDLLFTKPKWIQVVGKLLIGIWHMILQLLVPYILIRNGNYITWAVAAVLLVLPVPLAQFLLKKNIRFGVAILWFVYGVVMLTLPWTVAWITAWDLNQPLTPVFANASGWMGLEAAILAGLAGMIISCLWTGWYFAVCFAYNGHNNEIGGAGRIEEFKQFIRFRLTAAGLTGYVIGVDDVSKVGEVDAKGHTIDGSDLDFKLIDMFHLVPKA
jgi:hypothetical protein